MKKNTHPEFHTISVTCITCNAKYKIGTTAKELSIDSCSNCHPFYNGTATSIKSTGRVERFKRMFGEQTNKKKSK